jgi:RNA polymerase sigma-70 factor, ECF subfamily
METPMRTGATFETSAPRRSEVIKCVAHLRAFALLLAGDCQRADDLVRATILQFFTAANRPSAMISLKVQMFAGLRKLHYAAPRQSIAAQQSEPHSSKEDSLESDELLRIFGLLRDEQREALILTVASGLSHEQAAQVCDCHIDAIKSRILEAWREISRMMREVSPSGRSNSKLSLKSEHLSWSPIRSTPCGS